MQGKAPRRRSARLSAGREDIAQDANTAVEVAKEETNKEDDANATTPLRLFDLPAEIRNTIYSHAFVGSSYNLAKFEDPGIARVCRQARSESLPILYSDANWVLTVGSNIFEPAQWHNAGNLGLKLGTKKVLHEAGGAAIFRDVTIRITHHGQAYGTRQHLVLDESYEKDVIATLKITTHPELKCSVVIGAMYETIGRLSHWPFKDAYMKKVHDMLGEAQARASEMRARDGFKGLLLKDLDKIAKSFRLTPEKHAPGWWSH